MSSDNERNVMTDEQAAEHYYRHHDEIEREPGEPVAIEPARSLSLVVSARLHPIRTNMRLSSGVQWALHCAWLLALVPDGTALTASRLAEFYDLPESYLAKLLKALVRAGLLESSLLVRVSPQLEA